MSRRITVQGVRATRWAVGVATVLLLSVSPRSGMALATSYNNTNPAATPCGNGTHPVKVWATSYIYSGSTAIALVELRRSDYCNTVWTRITNLTSTSVSVAETTEIFSFPDPADRVGLTSSYDSLRAHGVFPYQAWSNQLDYPHASPPSSRATGSIYWSGSWRAVYAGSTPAGAGVLPSWTQEANNFDGGMPMSCNGTHSDPCESWAKHPDDM